MRVYYCTQHDECILLPHLNDDESDSCCSFPRNQCDLMEIGLLKNHQFKSSLPNYQNREELQRLFDDFAGGYTIVHLKKLCETYFKKVQKVIEDTAEKTVKNIMTTVINEAYNPSYPVGSKNYHGLL